MKKYTTPECSVYRIIFNDELCINLFGSEAGDDEDGSPIVGAKHGSYVYDDEAEEGLDSDI